MKLKSGLPHQQGLSIIEVLVALVVLALGLVALARFQSDMMQESGYSKMRSAAINLAQERIESLRNNIAQEQFKDLDRDGVEDGPVVEQTNTDVEAVLADGKVVASFTEDWRVQDAPDDPATPEPDHNKMISVTVSWVAPGGDNEQVTLSSQVAYIDPVHTANVTKDPEKEDEGSENLLPSPVGNATVDTNGKEYKTGSVPGDDSGYGDGVKINDTDNGTEIIDADGVVRLIIREGYRLVVIDGRVYTTSKTAIPADDVHVIASDASYCSTTPISPSGKRSWESADVGGIYAYFNYVCYVGESWHGNIGLIYADLDGCSTEIDVTDPNPTPCGELVGTAAKYGSCIGDGYWIDTTAARLRTYRGIAIRENMDGSDVEYSTGITPDIIDRVNAGVDGILGTADDRHHDFLLMNLGNDKVGDAATAKCTTQIVGAPATFEYNLDGMVCLTDTCPDEPIITISGHFTPVQTTLPTITSTVGAVCRINSLAYVCDIAEAPWTGAITLTTSGIFCQSGNHSYVIGASGLAESERYDLTIASSVAACPTTTTTSTTTTTTGVSTTSTTDISTTTSSTASTTTTTTTTTTLTACACSYSNKNGVEYSGGDCCQAACIASTPSPVKNNQSWTTSCH